MQLKVGDRVKLLNEVSEGIVTEIRSNDEILVHTNEGFDFPYPLCELIKVDEDSVEFLIDKKEVSKKIRFDCDNNSFGHKKTNSKYMLNSQMENRVLLNKRGTVVEVDLHLDELIPASMKVHNWEKIELQINYCKCCIDEAIDQKISTIVFIHGVGEGVLKAEIRKLFNSYSNIDYQDADYQRYGAGATQIHIRGLFSA